MSVALEVPGRLAGAVLAGCLLLTAIAGGAWWYAQDELGRVRLQEKNHSQRLAAVQQKPATTIQGSTAFTAKLPLSTDVARAVQHLRAAAESHSAAVLSVGIAEQAPTATTLGRLNLDFGLRGSYSAIKGVMAELLARDGQQAVLQQMTIRKTNQGGELEARAQVSWLSRPLNDAVLRPPQAAMAP